MAFKLDGKPLVVDVPFKTSDGTQYPANWLRLASADEKAALKITEVADDLVYDNRFYWGDGTAKALDDKTDTIDGVEFKTIGVNITFFVIIDPGEGFFPSNGFDSSTQSYFNPL